MKKAFFILGICAVISACGGNASKSDSGDSTTNQSTKAANSDADTNAVKTGAETPAAETASTTKVSSATGEALMAKADCNTCHKVDVKIVGPAFQDVAKKYEPTEANIDTLAHKIIKGGKGNWGDIPMAAHPTLAVNDAKEMVKYILSLKK
jgi:cytochrome c